MKETIAYNLVPQFIHEKYQAGFTTGQIKAVALFMDISGFTAMTESFMQHGKVGAEELAQIINTIFDPIIRAIYERGGFVTGFAGDALTAVYPHNTPQTALVACDTALAIREIIVQHSSYQTSFGDFALEVKQGLSVGQVEWGVTGPLEHKTYYFRGIAIDNCAKAEHQAKAGDIVLDESIHTALPIEMVSLDKGNGRYAKLTSLNQTTDIQKKQLNLPKISNKICHQFFPPKLWQYSGQGEFRQVSIIFLAFPDDLTHIELDEFITMTIQECDKFGGHFTEVDFGDKGGLALLCFGAPKAHENDVERALSFTHSLTKKLDALNLCYRVGITHGLVYAGMVGIPMRCKYATLGNVVNLASRLMVKAQWGQILVSEPVAQQPGFSFIHAGKSSFKGFAKPLSIYQLSGLDAESLTSHEVILVGRDAEKKKLLDFANPLLQNKSAGAAIIYGEPGIGKSVLVADFKANSNAMFTWINCQTDQILRQAFNPFITSLKHFFGVSEDASDSANKTAFNRHWQIFINQIQISDAPASLYQELKRTQSMLGALIGLRWQDSLYERLDSELRYENTITAVNTWLLAQSWLNPIVLLVEDGHWLDYATDDLLSHLSQEMSDRPILILITSRYLDNGERPKFNFAPTCSQLQIDLAALSPTSLRQQAEQILEGAINDGFFAFLQKRTQSNPFFAQQLILYCQDHNLLKRDQDQKWIAQVDNNLLPASINAMLIARIDRLSQRVKEVVQTAAVLGAEFELDILSQMLDTNIKREIKQAEANQIWSALTEIRYIFKHILLRDAAYDMQMRQQLRKLHYLAATAYEEIYKGNLAKHYASLAHHYKQANESKTEKLYARLAGEQAASRGNQQEAIAYFSRALALSTSKEEKCELLLLREEANHMTGDREKQAEDLIALARLILLAPKPTPAAKTQPLQPTSTAQLKQQVEVILRQVRYRSAISDYSATAVSAQRALQLSQEAEDLLLQVRSRYWWGESLERQGRHQEAREQFNLGLTLLQTQNSPTIEARFIKELGWIAFREGNSQLATQFLQTALQLVEQTGDQKEQMMVLKALGGASNAGGDYIAARSWQKKGLALARAIGHRLEEGSLLNNLGNTHRFLGDFETAVSYHKHGGEMIQKTGWRMGYAISQINLGLAYPYLGELDKAFQHAQSGLKIAQEIHARLVEAFSWYVLGNIAVDTQTWEAAQSAYHKSITIFQEISMPHYTIEAKSGLLRTYLAQDKNKQIKPLLIEILEFIDSGGNIRSVEEPMRVNLTCYQALERLEHPRAKIFLKKTYNQLQAQAAHLPPSEKQMFLADIPFHHAIITAWESQKESE